MIRKTAPSEIKPYLTDASNYSEGSADQVVIPESPQELMDFLKTNNRPITVAGAGTGLTASRVPLDGIVVSLEKLSAMGLPEKGVIAIGPAVRLKDLQDHLKGTSWMYPPNPTETFASIGGTVATNASGSRSFKWGATRNFVEELDIVLADGRYATLKRGMTVNQPLQLNDGSNIEFPAVRYRSPQCKNASGYFIQPDMDWVDLLVGSDGTLAMFTRIVLKLIPAPQGFFSAILFFDAEPDAWQLADTIKKEQSAGISPCAIEYFDGNSLTRLKQKFNTIPASSNAALFVEKDIDRDQDPDEVLEHWAEFLEDNSVDLENSWFAESGKDIERFHDFRHQLPLMINEENQRAGRTKMGTDLAVSDDHFLNLMNVYSEALKSGGVDYVVFGHIGDNHLHINLLPDQEQKAQAKAMYHRFVDQVLEWEGTVSAEHGIGKLKKDYYHQMVGPDVLDDLKKIKNVFDPGLLLGRGNIF